MSDVQFEEDLGGQVLTSRRIRWDFVVPTMAKGLMKTKIVKTERQAFILLVGIVILCFLTSIIFIGITFFGKKTTPLPPGVRVINEPGKLPRLVPLTQ
jgi:hypothetical protein